MKKLINLILGISLAVALLLGFSWGMNRLENHQVKSDNAPKQKETLTIYNWGDYIDPAILKSFQKETGYRVNYETFDSNEAMYTKIKQGGTHYDVAIPSEYMVEKMRQDNLLMPLDHDKLTGLQHYNPSFLNEPFDPNNKYSVPYFWGTLGIVYNDKYVKPGSITSWNDLWQSQYRKQIMLIDSARDIMGMTLASSGQSVNTKNEAELAAAQGKLSSLMPNVKAIVADEIKTYMAQDEAALAVDYSGDAAEMMQQNKHLHYVVPEDGGNLWFDNMVIPKTVQNKKAAYAFINYMSRPEVAAQNAEYVGYATPNQDAMKLLPKSITQDKAWYPEQAVLDRLETYQNLGPDWTQRYNDYFLEFKMTNQ